MNVQSKFQIDYDGYPLEVSVPSWMPVSQLKGLVEAMERLETLPEIEDKLDTAEYTLSLNDLEIADLKREVKTLKEEVFTNA